MRTADFVIGKWASIFEHYKLPPITGGKHYKGACPLCGSKGDFRIDDKDGKGSWICKCDFGDGWKLLTLVTGKAFKELAKEIDDRFGNIYDKENGTIIPQQRETAKPCVKEKFRSLPLLITSDAVEYLHSRGLYKIPNRGIKYSPGEYDDDACRAVPCMFAIASNEIGEPIYTHVTYIEQGKKADVPVTRKMRTVKEFDGSVAIKLFPPAAVLGIAEGIETALSAEVIYKVPTWSAINAQLMRRFIAPAGTETLYVFADNDWSGTGLAAAFECAKRNLLKKDGVNRVVVRWPKVVNDFNDLLMIGDDVCEWVLDKNRKVAK